MKNKQRIKLAARIGVVLYPSITLFSFLLQPVLRDMPLPLKTLLQTVVLVPWVVFIGLPFTERILLLFSGKKNVK